MSQLKISEGNSDPTPLSWFSITTLKYTPLVAELIVIAIVIRLLGLVQPFVYQTVIDRVLPFQREATLTLIVVVLAMTTALSASLRALSAYLSTHMANRLIVELARRIYTQVFNLPLQFLQKWQIGEVLSRIGEIDTIRKFLTSTVAGASLDALFAIIYVAALLSISPFLTLIVMVALPLQILAFAIIGPFIRGRMQEAFLAGSRHQSRMVETFGNAVVVKALASEDIQVSRFDETLDKSLASGFRVVKLNIVDGFVGDLLSMSNILIIFFGSKLVFENELTLGGLIAFNMLAEKVSGPIMSLSSLWEQWQGLKIARLRLGDLLNTAAETENTKPALKIAGPLNIRITDLTFGYTPDHSVIQKLSLDLLSAQPTIILGDSGCGKSTFAKLITGLYQPDSGTIEVNGSNLAHFDPQSVRRTLAYLPQEPALFSGSILENLVMAKPDATQAEIDQALADSASDRFIGQLRYGIHANVGERGGNLSGGQRQRIALARALLTNPRALVLDEPTSALDTDSTEIVVNTIKRLAREKTLIVITHNAELLGDEVTLIDFNLSDHRRGQNDGK